MNIDFHVHGILSKKLKFDQDLFLQGIEFAKNNNLDGYVLCEHFNALDIDNSMKFLEDNFPYEGDKYMVNDFALFLGMEVDIKYGGHIIVCGNRDSIYKIKNVLQNHKSKDDFIYFDDLLSLGEEEKCLMIGSHPYREKHKLYLQKGDNLKRLDALDLNSKDIYKKGRIQTEKEVNELSKKLNIPYVTGSDSHYPTMLGCVYTQFDHDIQNLWDLKNCIKNKSYKITVCQDLSLKIATAKIAKNYLKKKLKENRNS